METFEAIRTVLAVRQFRDTPVPDDVVREIVEAAHLTASSSNDQPWHFIVVRDKDTLRQLGALTRCSAFPTAWKCSPSSPSATRRRPSAPARRTASRSARSLTASASASPSRNGLCRPGL